MPLVEEDVEDVDEVELVELLVEDPLVEEEVVLQFVVVLQEFAAPVTVPPSDLQAS